MIHKEAWYKVALDRELEESLSAWRRSLEPSDMIQALRMARRVGRNENVFDFPEGFLELATQTVLKVCNSHPLAQVGTFTQGSNGANFLVYRYKGLNSSSMVLQLVPALRYSLESGSVSVAPGAQYFFHDYERQPAPLPSSSIDLNEALSRLWEELAATGLEQPLEHFVSENP